MLSVYFYVCIYIYYIYVCMFYSCFFILSLLVCVFTSIVLFQSFLVCFFVFTLCNLIIEFFISLSICLCVYFALY